MSSAPWPQARLRRVARIVGGGTPSADEDNWNGPIPFVTPPDLRPVHGGELTETGRTVTQRGVESGSTMVRAGSIALSKRAPIGYVSRLGVDAAFNQGCLVLEPDKTKLDTRFAVWALSVRTEELNALGRGTTFHELSASDCADVEIALPSLEAQRRVSDYLDRETAKIDTLIAKQASLIATLSERQDSLIAWSTVGDRSRSIPNDWYPNVGQGWSLARVKSVSRRITDGAHISPETEGGEFDFVSTRDVKGGLIDFDGALKTSPETYDYMVKTGCQPRTGDVLFSKDGTVGETAIVRDNRPFVVASSLVIITPDQSRMTPSFLSYALRSRTAREQAASMMRGAGLPRLSVGNLARLDLPVPPLEEQVQIATELDEQTAKIDSLTSKAREFIGFAKERRAALITAAVTGQLNVRGAA